jgi:hypothetical protein
MHAQHCYIDATIGLAASAGDARAARQIRHHADDIAGAEFAAGVRRGDFGADFVAHDARIRDKGLVAFEDVKIRAANADAPDAQQYFAGRRLRNRTVGEVEFAGRSAFNHAHGKTSAQLELVVGAWIHELLVPRWRPCQYAKLARCSRLVNLSDKL